MKKVIKVIYMVFLGLLLVGCGALFVEKVDFDSIPDPIDVSDTNDFYTTTSISYTGDPELDFGDSYEFVSTPLNDGGGNMKMGKIYVAYSKRFLYIGHKSPKDDVDGGPDYLGRGAFYVFIDNNITNGSGSKGMLELVANNNGITGSFDFLDDCGVSTVDGKISVYIKHYRPYKYGEPTGENFKIYKLFSGSLQTERIVGTLVSISLDRYLVNNITEVTIPWAQILGTSPEYIPDYIKMEFRTDDGGGGAYFSEANFATNVTTTNIISNWLKLNIK